MDKDRSSRAWFLTLNHPEQEDYIDLAGDGTDTVEQYEAAALALCDRWLNGGSRPRNPETNGVGAVLEVGDHGTLHAHLVINAKSTIEFRTVKGRFPRAHIEVQQGSVDEALGYLDKSSSNDPDVKAKAHTQLCDPVFCGDYFADPKQPGDSSLCAQIDGFLDQGMTPNEIFALGAKYAHLGRAVERRYNALQIPRSRARTSVKCVYHTGKPRTGKSSTYDSLVADGKDVCYISSYKNPFDSYDGEEVLFLDELRKRSLEDPLLLSLMETRIKALPARYGDKVPLYTELHLATILPPEKLLSGTEPVEQLLGRLDEIVYHYTQPDGHGGLEYKSVSIDPSTYTDIDSALDDLGIQVPTP